MDDLVILHLNGGDANHEVKTLRVVSPRCRDCGLMIEPERLRWFARKDMKATNCQSCSFQQKVSRISNTF
jgi:predicted Zn-ribbon and HTH transcriptional regulator